MYEFYLKSRKIDAYGHEKCLCHNLNYEHSVFPWHLSINLKRIGVINVCVY